MKKTAYQYFPLLLATMLPATAYALEHEVSVSNTQCGILLAGTLAMPDSIAPKAAIVLASGSGAQNRDEEIAGLRPFKVLSDSLASAGYAVLRMDDRGTASSQGDFQSALMVDLDSDIASGLAFLDSCCPGIPKGIIGHSQGGLNAIRLAASSGTTPTSGPHTASATHSLASKTMRPDFIVTLASPAWSGDSIIMSQSRALATAMTGNWPGETLQRKILDIAKGPLPTTVVSPLIYSMVTKQLGDISAMPQVQQQVSVQVSAVTATPYREMLRINPEAEIRNVAIPWLALNGDRDLQVLVSNLQTIQSLNPTATTIILPGHNHLFQEATTGLPQEYLTSGQSPSPATITAIISWLSSAIK